MTATGAQEETLASSDGESIDWLGSEVTGPCDVVVQRPWNLS